MDFFKLKAEEAEEAGDLDRAFLLWKDIITRDQDPASFCHYGHLATMLERWNEAESAFGAALHLDSSCPLAMEYMGNLWFSRTDISNTESFSNAKQWFITALKYERNARVLTFLGAAYKALHEDDPAKTSFEQAIELDPDYEEALYNLADLEKVSNPQRAIQLLERAVTIDPDYSLAHQELGKLYQHTGDLPRAEYHFRQSLQGDPTDYWSHLFLANVLAVQGKNIEAEQTYRFVISLRPEIKAGINFFARFLESIGKTREAEHLRNEINI